MAKVAQYAAITKIAPAAALCGNPSQTAANAKAIVTNARKIMATFCRRASMESAKAIRNEKASVDHDGGFSNSSLTMSYFHTGTRTIIGAEAFHGPVRDGKEWDHLAMVIRHNCKPPAS